MSINLEEIVLHQIQHHVEGENVELKTVLREELLPISPAAEQMMLQLHQAYQNKAKGYGVHNSLIVFWKKRQIFCYLAINLPIC